MDSKKKKIKIFRRSQHLSLIPIAPTPALVGRATWLRKVAGEGVVTETERKGRGRRGEHQVQNTTRAFTYRTLGGCLRSRGPLERRGEGEGRVYFGARCDETGENESRWPAEGAATVIQGPEPCSTNRRNSRLLSFPL